MIFTSPDTNAVRITDALEQAIARQLGAHPAVVVLSRAELAQVIANAYSSRGQ